MNGLRHLIHSVLAIGVALLAMALMGYCTKARAGDTFGVHLATAHQHSDGLQSANPGVYAQLASGATAGIYRNSYLRTSVYAGWSFQTRNQRLALTLGAVTGYPAARLMPLIVPSARIPVHSGVALRIAFIPKPARHGTSAGVHFSIEQELP